LQSSLSLTTSAGRGFLSYIKYVLYTIAGIILAFAILAVYLRWLQPDFYFPKPTGPYPVGARLYHWTDSARCDQYSNDSAHPHRELMVKIWYPASATRIEKPSMPYRPDLFAHIKKTQPLIWLLSGAARHMYQYEEKNASLAPSEPRFPVIIFSHGGGGTYDSNTMHCEELASKGYIVVGISHTYESTVVKFPDGRIKTSIDTAQHKNFIERRKQNDQGIVEAFEDVSFVLDQLALLEQDSSSFFYQRLDLEHIGIFGQSRGGSVATAMCRRDQRIKACVNMDGSLFGPDATKPFDKPCCFLLAGESVKMFDRPMTRKEWKTFRISVPQEEQMVKERYLLGFQKIAQGQQDKYIFVINGAGHLDLADIAILAKYAVPMIVRPIIQMALSGPLGCGPIDGLRVIHIVDAYLANFFDKYLKGQVSPLLDGGQKTYPEVKKRGL